MASKGRVQASVNLSGACAPPTLEETAATQDATITLRIQRIALSFSIR
jgi:hypothetical protein